MSRSRPRAGRPLFPCFLSADRRAREAVEGEEAVVVDEEKVEGELWFFEPHLPASPLLHMGADGCVGICGGKGQLLVGPTGDNGEAFRLFAAGKQLVDDGIHRGPDAVEVRRGRNAGRINRDSRYS